MVNVCSFIVKFHRIHNQCKIYSKITVKGNLRPTILMKHLTFVHHESMQHNQNYCHEKATWYERNAFVLNLGFFSNIDIFVLNIFISKLKNTSFVLTMMMLWALEIIWLVCGLEQKKILSVTVSKKNWHFYYDVLFLQYYRSLPIF